MNKKFTLESNCFSYYLTMLNDSLRNNFFYKSLLSSCKDKVVLDIGSGTGILSYYALMCGAKFVYSIEKDKKMSIVTDCILKKNFDKNKFKVLNLDFWNIDLVKNKINHNIDLIVSETIGNYLLNEEILKTWSLSKKLPHLDKIFIPNKVSIDLCVTKDIDQFYEKMKDLNINTITEKQEFDEKFFESLIVVDKIINKNNTIKKFNLKLDLSFEKIINNFYEFNYESSNYSEIDYKKITTKQINVEFPCIISLIFKVEHNDNTIFIKDGHWEKTPFFVINEAGIYNIYYDGISWNIESKI